MGSINQNTVSSGNKLKTKGFYDYEYWRCKDLREKRGQISKIDNPWERKYEKREIKANLRSKGLDAVNIKNPNFAKVYEQIGNPVKIDFLFSLASDNKSIMIDRRYYDRMLRRTQAIAGYVLKNVDTRDLIYLRAEYTDNGIVYHEDTVKPGERFIVTRHEVGPLGFMNSCNLSGGDWQIVMNTIGVPYIRHSCYTADDDDSVHSDMYKINLYYYGDDDVKDEYREKFEWLKNPLYNKKLQGKSFGENKKFIQNAPDIVVVDYLDKSCDLNIDEVYNLKVVGNTTPEQIGTFINKTKEKYKDIKIKDGLGYTIVEFYVEDKLSVYVLSTKQIYFRPRSKMRARGFGVLDFGNAVIYGNKLNSLFYGSTIEKLVLGELKSENNDQSKILMGIGNCQLLKATCSESNEICIKTSEYLSSR